MSNSLKYSPEPEDKAQFTVEFDRYYTRIARVYDIMVKLLPIWRNWLKQALPHIHGPRVLEASFGTGYLLTQYAGEFKTFGVDYNQRMATTALNNLRGKGMQADLQTADVGALPYPDDCFDSIVNTMAFSGYPDGRVAMAELHRTLKPGGRLILIDVNYPADRNRMGMLLTRFWVALGDILRDMDALLDEFGFRYQDAEIGGFGSIHLYVAEKKE